MVLEDHRPKTRDELVKENKELLLRLEEAEDTLNAIQNGEIDAIVTQRPEGSMVYTLEGSDYLYRVLVQEISEGVAILTSEDTIFYSNLKLASMVKLPLERLFGRKLSDFIHIDDLETFKNILQKRLKGGKGEVNIKTVDGINIPVSISVKTLEGLEGSYVIITDLREQKHYEELKKTQKKLLISNKELQRSEERYRNIIDNLQDAYMRDNNEGLITMVSPSSARMYGYGSPEKMIDLPIISLYKNPEDRKFLLTELKKQGKLDDYESEGLRTDGSSFPVSMNVQFHYDEQSKIKGTEVLVRDMTIRKKAEEINHKMLENEQQLTEELNTTNEELKATTEELQTSNEELMLAQTSLRELVDKLRNSNKELEQFAYVASHDLQEPLRMVASFTQLLERRYKGQMDEDADEFIEFIVEGANRMKDLINDLLAFSRLNTEAKEFEKILMKLTLYDVLTNLKPTIKENNARITHDPLPTIKGEPSQINQLLQNLIANGIKFHGNKPPKIHISAQEFEKEWLFSVTDNGIGIDPDYQTQIFNIFKRLHTKEEYPGTGIGLAICKRIVERHGGSIWVESEEGKGSTFYFTIPQIYENK
ncbi:MAG: PAS domain S-box protein [Methanobacteriaceae archaeon]|nr:PAS domain S-box protein [Methanobacteriaceae archaeon]